ncbi:malic enzyme [Musa troglodytarum]|uniref:Malic enzyme n=1 Tax=Musa troglodytarum TaxID=320322 RepID=A0A9E7GWL0_9LILI|nr:malic enzyme [Musa troglodytarum]
MAFSSSLPRLLRRTSSSLPLRWRLRMFLAGKRSRPFTTCEGSRPTILHKRSIDILHDPWFNKGTAFSITERDRLDLRGLLPPNVMTPRQQINRFMVDLKRLELNASDGPSDTIALAKWRILNRLHDRNETMYYKVDMIVVTDGSRILGLGDLGVQGIGIAIGKLDLYVAAAGINPQRFEDFQSKWAFKLLQRYRSTYRMFNDDVQGTAGVAIAGLLGAVRAQGKPMIDFPKQKIVVAGAGSAGIGVLNAARKTMARMLGNNEFAFEGARSQFWVVDAMGLLTEGRMNIDPEALPFARKLKESERHGLHEGASLAEVVTKVKPDVLLGLSAVGGLFSKEVLEALKDSSSTRPAIFAMSNPTQNAECTPEEAFSTVGDHIVFASGSPFHDVDLGNGKIGHCNQGNNMYLFPGSVELYLCVL